MPKELIVILHNIRSVHNVGAIFRTADAAGLARRSDSEDGGGKIYLTGYTPTPIDQYGRARKDFHKAALGAEDTVSWEHKKTLGPLLKKIKEEGIELIALEQDSRSIDYKKYKLIKPTALIVGNEVNGVSKQTLDKCDKIIEIPMRGKKESLNVSVATGIVLYRLLDV